MSDQATKPRVSVIVPTYQRPDLLHRALLSVQGQTLPDFEAIIVDDGPDERSESVVASFSDPRFRYLSHPDNRGLAAARNTGIAHARSATVAFLDDDDELLPRYLEVTVGILEGADAGDAFVACGVREVDRRGEETTARDVVPPRPAFENTELAYRSFLARIPFSGWFITARRQALLDVGGFDEVLRTEQDRDLLCRLVREHTYAVAPEILALHHFHDQPHVNVYGPKKAAAFSHLLDKHREAIAADPALWAAWSYKLGWLHHRSGQHALGRRYMLGGLRRRPWDHKLWWGLVGYSLLGGFAEQLHSAASRARKRSQNDRATYSRTGPAR